MPRPGRPRSKSWVFCTPQSVGALASALCLLLGAAGPSIARDERPAVGDAALSERLDRVLDSRALKRARVSVLVTRDRDGQTLYERSADRALIPASNQKILTALAVLSTFGPTHRFETVVRSDAPVDAEGAVGTLVIQGGGDPVMNSEDWWLLASGLRNHGVRRVRGDLVLDDSAFDRDRWHASWGATSSRAYHAPVGALTANYGSFSVTVEPGEAVGDPVRVTVDPPVPYLRVSNGARTGHPRSRRSLVVDRSDGGNGVESVTVQGTVRQGDPPKTFYRSVLDPTRYAGAVLAMQLAAVGIQVEGTVRTGSVETAGHELLRHEGRQVAEIVRLFVKYSNNAIAESLVKALGARASGLGSWSSGTPELRRALLSAGLQPDSFEIVDGSGLSYENKVTPRALVRALREARRSFAYGPELVAALPIAAWDGTLEKRTKGAQGEVRAKTGLLNSITCLSGFAHLGDGDLSVFSILVNGYRVSDEEAMQAVDQFVAELVRPIPTSPGESGMLGLREVRP